jgi:hypothetical protein
MRLSGPAFWAWAKTQFVIQAESQAVQAEGG